VWWLLSDNFPCKCIVERRFKKLSTK
jgi:hypothetical protein